MTQVNLRNMSTADEPFCCELSRIAGWNQTSADWRRALELEPEGAWIAIVHGQEAGTATVCRFASIGWIALMLVSPPFRSQGVGRALFTHAVNYLEANGVHSLRLDATPLGQPLYAQFGFSVEFELERYAGRVAPSASLPAPTDSLEIADAESADMADIALLDQSITATDRARFLERLFSLAPTCRRIARDAATGKLLGYSLARPGRLATQIGPCLASEERAGRTLLADALLRHVGQEVFVDIPVEHAGAASIASQLGLRPQRRLARMGRGPRITESLAGFWSGSGPEKG